MGHLFAELPTQHQERQSLCPLDLEPILAILCRNRPLKKQAL